LSVYYPEGLLQSAVVIRSRCPSFPGDIEPPFAGLLPRQVQDECMEAFVEQCAAMQRRMGELTNEAAEVEPVVDALVKSHAEFEVRKDRYKKALAK